jgi:hypothetical protein
MAFLREQKKGQPKKKYVDVQLWQAMIEAMRKRSDCKQGPAFPPPNTLNGPRTVVEFCDSMLNELPTIKPDYRDDLELSSDEFLVKKIGSDDKEIAIQ